MSRWRFMTVASQLNPDDGEEEEVVGDTSGYEKTKRPA